MKRTLTFIGIALVVLMLYRHNGDFVGAGQEEDAQPAVVTPRATDAPIWRAEVADDAIAGGLQAVSQLTFMGRPCQGDCAPYMAGYRWAEREGINDPQACAGDGEFRAGCAMYAEMERDYNR